MLTTTKTTTRAAKPAAKQEKPAAVPITRNRNPERYAAFVEAARKAVDDRLEGYFKGFIENGIAEEKNFFNEVFCARESCYFRGKGHGEREVALFSAIQDQLDGMHLVPVESEAMVREVEKFITDKIAAGWKAPDRRPSWPPESEDEIKARLRTLISRQMQFFTLRCKRSDLIFMIDLLEQWESLTDNPEFWQKTEYPLAAAAELHLDVMKRREKELAA